MFGTGPKVNNVLASMTDKIVCATFSADPNLSKEQDEDTTNMGAVEDDCVSYVSAGSDSAVRQETLDKSMNPSATVSSLALAAAPLLTTNFTFDTRGLSVLKNFSAPSSRRCSDQQDAATATRAQLSLVGDYANSGALAGVPLVFNMDSRYQSTGQMAPRAASSVQDLVYNLGRSRRNRCGRLATSEKSLSSSDSSPLDAVISSYPLSPRVMHRDATTSSLSSAASLSVLCRLTDGPDAHLPANRPTLQEQVGTQVDCSVRSAQATPQLALGRPGTSLRPHINTDDLDRFTEEVTV